MVPISVPDLVPAHDLCAFIDASPSPFHAVAEAGRRLVNEGFVEVDPAGDLVSPGPKAFFRRDGMLIAWIRGDEPAPFKVVGAHTDSPNLRLKPRPDANQAGFGRLGVEVYGGVLLNSWLDRDLGLSGRVVLSDDSGGHEVRLVRLDEPVGRVPQLAIHLDREQNEGLTLDQQRDMAPIWAVDPGDGGCFTAAVAERIGVAPEAVLASELMFHDLQPSRVIGLDRSMIAAPRIDNLLSCHAAVAALAQAEATDHTLVVCLYDHEEVGSVSVTGAAGPHLARILERLSIGVGADRQRHLGLLYSSTQWSIDGAHASHPNRPDRHEPEHPIRLNAGPVVKLNANQRYASDAPGVALVVESAARAGVDLQYFVTRSDLPCGSTIGPASAAELGMTTVDLGAAQLSMHSARELCGTRDPADLAALLSAWFAM